VLSGQSYDGSLGWDLYEVNDGSNSNCSNDIHIFILPLDGNSRGTGQIMSLISAIVIISQNWFNVSRNSLGGPFELCTALNGTILNSFSGGNIAFLL